MVSSNYSMRTTYFANQLYCTSEMGTDLQRSGSEVRLDFSGPDSDLNFWEKAGPVEPDSVWMVWCI